MNAKCSHCNKVYNKVDETMIGLTIKCKSCRETFKVQPISSLPELVPSQSKSIETVVSTDQTPGLKPGMKSQENRLNPVPPKLPNSSQINQTEEPVRLTVKPPQIRSSNQLDEVELPTPARPWPIAGLISIVLPIVAITLFLIFSGSIFNSSNQNKKTDLPDTVESAKSKGIQVVAKKTNETEIAAKPNDSEDATGLVKNPEMENEQFNNLLQHVETKPDEKPDVAKKEESIAKKEAADPLMNPSFSTVINELLSYSEKSQGLMEITTILFYAQISQQADAGNVRAQFFRSLCLMKGIGTGQNIIKGETELKLLAINGDIGSIKHLGFMYYIGYIVEENEAESRRIYQLGCEKNDPHCCAWYGRFLTEGIGGPEDDIKGVEYLKKSASAGSKLGINRLAAYYLQDDDDSNNAIAEELLIKNIEDGDLMSHSVLGLGYLRGVFGPVQTQKGMELLTKAAKSDSLECQEELAKIYLDGKYGITKNRDAAVYWLEESIKNGSASSLVYRGMVAEEDGDVQRALDSWARAEAKGENFATYLRGNLMLNSGIRQNSEMIVSEGIGLIERAAKKGETEAIVTLAKIYGFGVKILEIVGKPKVIGLNQPEAFRICQIAANEGDPDGMRLLADFYRNGIGTRRDIGMAQSWRTKADRADNRENDQE